MTTSGTAISADVVTKAAPVMERDETARNAGTFSSPLPEPRMGSATTDAAVETGRSGSPSLDPRAAGRRIAAMTPAAERNALYAEQQRLAIKKVTASLTPAEERRLNLVRWNLDRIEDADLGPEIDYLDARANMVEQLATNVQDFLVEVRKRQRR